ncbi:S9 family peptidase [Sphingomonas sp. YR710]|uniref:alpha/beta hydrolase family protein n=1 Tax=Sphingomonas sp. YR710 TaxID=1882773 RepID=UPI0015A32C31|nr:S9 family peptidase [Sphingomonas sp. YR710]
MLALLSLNALNLSSVGMAATPSLEIYGKLPGFERAAISASGDHIALIGTVGADRRILILDKNMEPVSVRPLGDAKVRGLYWAGDSSVLVEKSVTAKLAPGEFTTEKAELAAMIVIPLDGGKMWSVFERSDTITGGIAGYHGVAEHDGKWFGYFGGITFEDSKMGGYLISTKPVLYEVDLSTQHIRKIAARTEQGSRRNWLIGPNGGVSATFDLGENGRWTIVNAKAQGIASGTNPLGTTGLIGFGSNSDTLLYFDQPKDDTNNHWYQIPLAGGSPQEVFQDVAIRATISDSRTRTLAGYEIEGDVPAYRLFNARQQKIIDATQKAFPGLAIDLIDWNDAFDRLIVKTDGVGDPGTWWLVDIKTGDAKVLGISYALHAADVAPMKMIRYKAGDGMDISAVLTLPPGRPAKNLPVIVFPHGGPAARDYPGFDWWAQAFASRGYAVLQPNFRGSSGYGVAFEKAGHGEWGGKMQSDLSDGLAQLVKDGIADPKRACIMGASYGGYAALAGVTLQQGIYRCAVAVAGVSNVGKMASTDIDESADNRMTIRGIKDEIGSGRDLAKVSPIRFIDKVAAPILLIHGKDDTVVAYEQSKDMASALLAAGKTVEFITLPNEDHWLSKSETRLAMLKAAIAFVEKYNPSDTSP